MNGKYLAAVLFGAASLAAPHAFADSQVKANEIVDFFAKSANQGATRGICIGTTAECEQSKPKPAGFDMLINFELNSTQFTTQAQENLKEFAKALSDRRLSTAHFVVEGHTDARGTDEYNFGLSERRAQAVTAFLLKNGIAGDRVTAVGMGKTKPRTADPMDAINRRVELRLQVQ